jgi:hypothetical protein
VNIKDWMTRRKAIKMGASPSSAAAANKTQQQGRYDANDFFSRDPEIEDRALAHDETFRSGVSTNPFAR